MPTNEAAPIPARAPRAEYRHFIWDTRRWRAFRHRPGDIFVCTPPKCGTTWTQTIVAMLLFPDGNLPAPVMEMAPWLDARFYPLDEQIARLEAQTHRRSIKTHTSADGIPWWPDAYYIVVGRDGRDTFMSFVNHIASLREDKIHALVESAIAEGIEFEPLPPQEDIHEFFADWLERGDLFRFLSTYWELRDQPNVLFVHYNDLKADLEKEVRRIAAFLGIPVDEDRLPGILERCSFEWMKKNSWMSSCGGSGSNSIPSAMALSTTSSREAASRSSSREPTAGGARSSRPRTSRATRLARARPCLPTSRPGSTAGSPAHSRPPRAYGAAGSV